MAKNIRKCKVCKVEFTKLNPLQYVCSIKCSIEDAKIKLEKKGKAEWHQRKSELKQSTRTKSTSEKELQPIINSIIRSIDYGQKCISSGLTKFKMDAGHFYSRGSCPQLRFNLFNIYGQSVHDNQYKSGNIHGYIDGLIDTFGFSHYEYVRSLKLLYPPNSIKLSIEEIDEKIVIAKQILTEIGGSTKINTPEERIALRLKYNQMLGIY